MRGKNEEISSKNEENSLRSRVGNRYFFVFPQENCCHCIMTSISPAKKNMSSVIGSKVVSSSAAAAPSAVRKPASGSGAGSAHAGLPVAPATSAAAAQAAKPSAGPSTGPAPKQKSKSGVAVVKEVPSGKLSVFGCYRGIRPCISLCGHLNVFANEFRLRQATAWFWLVA